MSRKKKYFAWILSMGIAVTGLGGFSQGTALASREQEQTQKQKLEDRSFHRVITGNNNGVIRYDYEDASGQALPVQTDRQAADARKRKKLSPAEEIPALYDPRGSETETPIRDQTDTGACWAFGALKSLEGSMIAQGVYEAADADLSENHLAWYLCKHLQDTANPLYGDYFLTDEDYGYPMNGPDIYAMGGNAIFASFILANRWGAVAEEDAPFADSSVMAEAMEKQPDSLRWQSEVQMTEALCFDDASQQEIKREIMENGAMEVSVYYPETQTEKKQYLYEEEGLSSLYQDRTTPEGANHCVTIVGWDDNFTAFKKDPQSAGAWLVANSYGTDSNDGGYFWVSYEDTALCEFYSFHGIPGNTYDTAYQYDGFGWGDGYFSEEDIAVANVFTNQEETAQAVSAVGFYTYSDGQDYEINIFRNLGEKGAVDGEWVERCTTEGTEEYSGYHTVELTEPIAVGAGEKFSVVITFPANTDYSYVMVEGVNDPKYGYAYYGRKGESFVYFEEDKDWYDTVEEEDNNVCIKAFAKSLTEEEYQEQEAEYAPSEGGKFLWSVIETPTPTPNHTSGPGSPAPLQTTAPPKTTAAPQPTRTPDTQSQITSISCKGKLVLGKGEHVTLPIKTSPSGLQSTLKYQSSNTKTVAVNANGTIHAKKTGNVTITVSSASGVQKQIRIQVKKAPKSIRITTGKKTLKQGKSTKLKVKLSSGSASYSLKYTSGNKKVASVSADGKIKAKKAGTAKIRVATFNHKKAVMKIKVVR